MKILGIETSCDETACALVEDGSKILTSVVASSLPLHAQTGGVIPEAAAREQVKSIVPVLSETIKNTPVADISAIAVTYGPGLVGSLLVGIEAAKALSFAWKKPLIPVNHLVGHFYSAFLEGREPAFPILALIVSGGHTELLLAKNHGDFKYLGGTRDDAAGEAFDKVARLLGLGYPGGPAIQKASALGDSTSIDFPLPLLDSGDFDFSFSGLKTAAKRELEKNPGTKVEDFAASFQKAVVEVLLAKSKKAFEKFGAKSFVLGGGVAANSSLRERATEIFGEKLFISDPKLSIDNGAMIASAAFYDFKPVPWQEVQANPALQID